MKKLLTLLAVIISLSANAQINDVNDTTRITASPTFSPQFVPNIFNNGGVNYRITYVYNPSTAKYDAVIYSKYLRRFYLAKGDSANYITPTYFNSHALKFSDTVNFINQFLSTARYGRGIWTLDNLNVLGNLSANFGDFNSLAVEAGGNGLLLKNGAKITLQSPDGLKSGQKIYANNDTSITIATQFGVNSNALVIKGNNAYDSNGVPYVKRGDTTGMGADFIQNIQSLTAPQVANISISGTSFIGDGSITALLSTNARNVIAITTDPNVLNNEHLNAENSIFIKNNPGYAVASYDAYTRINGTTNTNHAVGFQSRLQYNNSGTISNFYGGDMANSITAGTVGAWWDMFLQPIKSGGSITKRTGLQVSDFATTGGTVTDEVGINVSDLTQGTNSNYSIITGSAPNRFAGETWLSNYSGAANSGQSLVYTAGTGFTRVAKIYDEFIASNQANLHLQVRTSSTAGDAGLTDLITLTGGAAKNTAFTGGVQFPTAGFVQSNGVGSNSTYVNSTGTGNVVLSASPTLTGTPILANATVNGSLLYNASAGNTMMVGSSTTSLTNYGDLNGSTFTPSLQSNNATISGIGTLANDGVNNWRAALAVNSTSSIWGLSIGKSGSTYIPFTIRTSAGTEWLGISTAGLFKMPAYTAGISHFDASGNITSSNVVNADITNATIDLTTKVTGVLPTANGGATSSAYVATSTGRIGTATLTAGTVAVSITGITTSSKAFCTRTVASGTTLTQGITAVCTAGTLTITADVAAGTINTADISTYNYIVVN